MTRKELEQQMKTEMQQNIPDKEALWLKIEQQLPEQSVSVEQKRISHSGRKWLSLAACLLLVFAGVKFFPNRENIPSETQNSGVNQEEQIDLTQLGTTGEYFNEDDILTRTDLFIDVKISSAHQLKNGNMQYVLEILDVYGGEWNESEIELETESAYLLKENHEYVLPVYFTERNKAISLSYECAPQIERTQENQLLIPNSWYTLMQGDVIPVEYAKYGRDDYFYDRMYLTNDIYLTALIQKFENLNI